jgi:hypothetical protein
MRHDLVAKEEIAIRPESKIRRRAMRPDSSAAGYLVHG